MSCTCHMCYVSIYATVVILSTLTLSKKLNLDCEVNPRSGTKCYTVYVDDKLNQSDAARRCRRSHQNGRLATVLDPRTSAHLIINLNKINATRQEYWIGAQLQLLDKWTWLSGTEDSTIFLGEYGYAKAMRNQLNQTELLVVPFSDPVDGSAEALCMRNDCNDATASSCYFLRPAHRWHEARNKCIRNHDADLALSLPPGVMQSNRRYFIGLRRVLVTWIWNSSRGRTAKTGTGVEDLAYTNWMHTAPRTTSELCLVLKDDYSSWRWDVANCNANRSFICEHNGSNTTKPVRTPVTRSSRRTPRTTPSVTTHSNYSSATLTQRQPSTTAGAASPPGENLVTLTYLVSTRKVNTKPATHSSSMTTSKAARVSTTTTSRHSTIKPTTTTASTSRTTTKTSSSSSSTTTTTTTTSTTTTTTTDMSTLVIPPATVARSSKNPVPLNVQSSHSSISPERASAGPSPVLLVCSILVIIVLMIVFIVIMVVVRLNMRRKSNSSTSHSTSPSDEPSSPVVATNVDHPVVNGQPQQDPTSTVTASGGPSTDQYAAVIRRHSSRTHKRTGSVAAGVHSFSVVEPQHSEAVGLRLSKQENGELARGRESRTQKKSRLSTPLRPSDGHHTVDDNGNNVVYADILPSKYPHNASTPDTPIVYASLDNVTQL